LQQLAAQVRTFGDAGGFQKIAARLECSEANLSAMRQLLEREYGLPSRVPVSFDPTKEPAIALVNVTNGQTQAYDIYADLGQRLVRGHVANVGDNPVKLRFGWWQSADDSVKYSKGTYKLMPSEALDFSFFFDVLNVSALYGDGEVQIFAQ
jgi:hypothetical protein